MRELMRQLEKSFQGVSLDAMAQRLAKWCSVRTGSYDADALHRLADILVHDLADLGAEARRESLPPHAMIDDGGHEVRRELGPCLVWRKRPQASRQILLAIHTDVVYAEGERGDADLKVRRDGDWLHGAGAVDAKGGLAVLHLALQALESSPWADGLGWRVVLNPDEEIGSPGSAEVLRREAEGCRWGLLFEPALPDGALVGERKGSGNFTLVLRGRAAHAGRHPEAGRNAVHALAECVGTLAALQDLGAGLSVNTGRFVGGDSVNRVPDLAVARVNFRVRDDAQQAHVLRALAVLGATWGKREGYALEVRGGFTAPPKPLAGAGAAWMDRVLECAAALGQPLPVRSSGGVCDGNRLAAAGLPNVDTLGPVGEGMHGAGERLYLPSVTQRAALTALVLLKLARDKDWG